VIWWLRERCGKSEEVHSAMKSDLAGGQLPSGLFIAGLALRAAERREEIANPHL
jgi:hypothetical protein